MQKTLLFSKKKCVIIYAAHIFRQIYKAIINPFVTPVHSN